MMVPAYSDQRRAARFKTIDWSKNRFPRLFRIAHQKRIISNIYHLH